MGGTFPVSVWPFPVEADKLHPVPDYSLWPVFQYGTGCQ